MDINNKIYFLPDNKSLNIDYHIKKKILNCLNQHNLIPEHLYLKLGISRKSMYSYMKKYNIKKDKTSKKYYITN